MVWSNQAANSLVFPPGAVTGARITIDGSGMVIYDSNNHPIFVASIAGVVPGNDLTDNPIVFGLAQVGAGITNGTQQFYSQLLGETVTTLGSGQGPLVNAVFLQARTSIVSPPASIGSVMDILGDGWEMRPPHLLPDLINIEAAGFSIGVGLPGLYYYEEITCQAPSAYGNGVVTPVMIGATLNRLISDYADGVNYTTGLWTPPVPGIYHFEMSINMSAWGVASGTFILEMLQNGVSFSQVTDNIPASGGSPNLQLSGERYCVPQDSISLALRQASGAARGLSAIPSTVSIRRVA